MLPSYAATDKRKKVVWVVTEVKINARKESINSNGVSCPGKAKVFFLLRFESR